MSDYLLRMATRTQTMPETISTAPLQPFVRSKSPVADQDQRLLAPGFEDLASPVLSAPVTTPPEENASLISGALTDLAIQRKTDTVTAASSGKSPLGQHTGATTSIIEPLPVLTQPHNNVPDAGTAVSLEKTPLGQHIDATTSINYPSPVLVQPHKNIPHAPPVTERTGINPAALAKPPVGEPQIGSEASDLPMTRRQEPTKVRPTKEQASTPITSHESTAQVSARHQTIEQSFVDVTDTYNVTEVRQEAQVVPQVKSSSPPSPPSPNELIPSVRPMVDFPANEPLREPEPPAKPESRPESGKGEEQVVKKIVQQGPQVATQPATAASVSVIGPLNRDVPIHRRLSLRHR